MPVRVRRAVGDRHRLLHEHEELDVRLRLLETAEHGLERLLLLEAVLGRLKETQSNVEFLMLMQKSMPVANGAAHSHGHETDHR